MEAEGRGGKKKSVKHVALVVSLPGAPILSFLSSSLISPSSRAYMEIAKRLIEMKSTKKIKGLLRGVKRWSEKRRDGGREQWREMEFLSI